MGCDCNWAGVARICFVTASLVVIASGCFQVDITFNIEHIPKIIKGFTWGKKIKKEKIDCFSQIFYKALFFVCRLQN